MKRNKKFIKIKGLTKVLNMPKSTLINSVFSVIKNISVLLFPLITFSYASRILLADGMGKLNFSQSIISYFVIFAMLGINNYGTREAARLREDRDKLSKFVREIQIINLCAVIISYILLFVSISLVGKLSDYRGYILIFSLSISLTALGMDWLYTAVEDYKYIALRTIAFQILSFILVLTFIREYEDLYKYAIILVISSSGSNIFNFIHSKKYVNFIVRSKLNIKKHIKPIFLLFILVLLIQIFCVSGSTILGFLTDDRNVGLYNAAGKISGIIVSLLSAVTVVLFPRFSYLIEQKRIDEVKSAFVKMFNYCILFGIPLTIGTIVLSHNALLLFAGEDFLDANIAMKILSLRAVFSAINGLFIYHIFIAFKKDKICLICTAAAAILNIILNFTLIPKFAANGAAWACVGAQLIEFIFCLFFVSKIIPLKPLFNKIWHYTLSAAPIIPIYLITTQLALNIYLEIIMIITLSIILYFGLLVILKNQYLFEIKGYVKQILRRNK